MRKRIRENGRDAIHPAVPRQSKLTRVTMTNTDKLIHQKPLPLSPMKKLRKVFDARRAGGEGWGKEKYSKAYTIRSILQANTTHQNIPPFL